MKKLPAIVAKKGQVHDRYTKELDGLPGFRAVRIDPQCEPVFWFTSFLCDDPDALCSFLREQNIQTRRFFLPLHQQPCYADQKHIRLGGDFSVSESIHRQGISLPSSYSLTADDQTHVIGQIRRFYADRG